MEKNDFLSLIYNALIEKYYIEKYSKKTKKTR